MSIQSEPILDAALKVFARYGIKKTTMGDIAKEADVSRQTLYGKFESKDGILSAGITYLTQKILAQTEHEWTRIDTLSGKIWVYFEHSTIEIFHMLQNSPDADDLVSGANKAAKSAISAAEIEKAKILTKLFTPYKEALATKGQSPAMLGKFVAETAAGQKNTAKTEDELISGLRTLRSLVLNFLGEAEEGNS